MPHDGEVISSLEQPARLIARIPHYGRRQMVHSLGLGLENVVTVVMEDAVLVADAGRMQDVRDVVEHLEKAGVSQANQHAKDYQPYGGGLKVW